MIRQIRNITNDTACPQKEHFEEKNAAQNRYL